MVTKEMLLAKRDELQKAFDDAKAQMNAFGGALQFCDHLIAEIDAEEKEKP
jgi:hypothetical protein